MKTPIFKDPAVQHQFDQDGFVKIQLFGEATIAQLKALREKHMPGDSGRFVSSSYLNDFAAKKEISEAIVGVIAEEMNHCFSQARIIGGAFLVKGTGPRSEMPMHQDWTIVDESMHYAVNIWIPLTETNETNGTLELVKGSHQWNEAVRAPTLPMAFEGNEEYLKQHTTIVPAKVGEVVVLNQATVHYSKPNLSEEIRPAITVGLVSDAASLRFYFWDSDKNQLEEFAQADDFLLKFEDFHQAIYQRPTFGESVRFIDYSIPRFSKQELQVKLGSAPDTPLRKSFLQRIFGAR